MKHGPPLDSDLAAEIERKVIDAATTVLEDRVVAVVVKGSAINGDFIPYFSDFDAHIYVDETALRGPRSLSLEYTLRFQELFSNIEPDRYQVSQVQVIFLAATGRPDDWLPPVPGTYRVVHGSLPAGLTVLDEDMFERQARAGLKGIDDLTNGFLERIVDKPDGALAPIVRLMGTFLKPALRQAATVLGAPPIDIWTWSQTRVLDAVEPAVIPDGAASSYFSRAQHWSSARNDPSQLRAMIVDAHSAFGSLAAFSRLHHR